MTVREYWEQHAIELAGWWYQDYQDGPQRREWVMEELLGLSAHMQRFVVVAMTLEIARIDHEDSVNAKLPGFLDALWQMARKDTGGG